MSKFGSDGFGGDVSSRFPSPLETLPQVRLPLPPTPVQAEESGDHGFACKHPACGFVAKSAHGFGRHLRTHGFGVMGRHFNR